MTASLNMLISQLIPVLSVIASDTPVNQTASTMPSTLDSLINRLVPLPLKILGANTDNAAKTNAQLVEALVLSSKPLGTINSGETHYKLLLSNDQQRFEMISKAPILIGSQVHLKINDNKQSAVLLKVIANGPPSAATTTTNHIPASDTLTHTATTVAKAPLSEQKSPATLFTAGHHTTNSSQHKSSPLNSHSNTSARQIIAQGVRQSLPLQEPTQLLVRLLQQVLTQDTQHWPKALNQGIQHLLQQFPTAEQMQQTQTSKKAIENSGIFLESKLARLSMTKPSTTQAHSDHLATRQELQPDIKAALQSLSQLVSKSLLHPATSAVTTDDGITEQPVLNPLLHSAKPLLQAESLSSNSQTSEQNLDVVLRQLSRQLLASIARTQFNQLESLGSRQSNSIDHQGPHNTWVTDIPIVHGKHVDNLSLRIEQEIEQSKKRKNKTQTLWTVMLAFDLHTLGKMHVQLKVINTSVSATVWSAQEKTHSQVKQHIDELTNNLEKVGVSVTAVDCQLGLPEDKKSPLLQQLVDVRT